MPLTSFLFLNPFSVSFRPTPFVNNTRFLAKPCTSDLIGTPDLSLPPVIVIFPESPTIDASVSAGISKPSKGFASVSFTSLEIDLPFLSDIVNL